MEVSLLSDYAHFWKLFRSKCTLRQAQGDIIAYARVTSLLMPADWRVFFPFPSWLHRWLC